MKEMLKRAIRTFFQAAAGYLATNIAYTLSNSGNLEISKTLLTGLAASALAAGIAAVMNMPRYGSCEELVLSEEEYFTEEENEA